MASTPPYPPHPLLKTALDIISNDFQPTQEGEEDEAAPDKKIAADLSRLTLEEQTRVQDDILGALDVIDETDEAFVQDRVLKMQEALHRMATAEPSSAYNIALRQAPEYVQGFPLLLKFLRADLFDPHLAASRLIKYFKFIMEHFGETALGRPVTFEDLDKDARSFLKSGKFQLLRSREKADRAVIFEVANIDKKYIKSQKSVRKAVSYFLSSIVESSDIGQEGVVAIAYYVGDFQPNNSDLEVYKALATEAVVQAMPIRFAAVHVCISNALAINLVSRMIKFFTTDIFLRVKLHNVSSLLECRHILMSHGIPADQIPVTDGEQLKLKRHAQWMRLLRIREESIKKTGSFDGVCLPRSMDVLSGRGQQLTKKKGNKRLTELLEANTTAYNASSQKLVKARILEKIIEEIRKSGRFLEKSDAYDYWYEISDERACYLLTRFYQNQRGYVRKKQARQEITNVEGPSKRSKNDNACFGSFCN